MAVQNDRGFQRIAEISDNMIRKPNFLIIGAQKAGTTWLWAGMKEHPEIYLPPKKELEFFSYPKTVKKMGLDGYLNEYFSAVTDEIAVGEATPSYFWTAAEPVEWCEKAVSFEKNIPQVVYDFLGLGTKLFLILRNPVERAISGFLHHIGKGRLEITDDILQVGRRHGIIHIGFYYRHLREWLNVYPITSFKVLIFEEAVKQGVTTFAEIFQLLGVNPHFVPSIVGKVVYKGVSRIRSGHEVYVPKDGLHFDPNTDPGTDPNLIRIISEDQYTRLKEIYRRDIEKLSGLLSCDLGFWLNE